MTFDSWGLAYERPPAGRGLRVRYPYRNKKTGDVSYNGMLMFDPRPEMRRAPESERSVLWRNMLEAP